MRRLLTSLFLFGSAATRSLKDAGHAVCHAVSSSSRSSTNARRSQNEQAAARSGSELAL